MNRLCRCLRLLKQDQKGDILVLVAVLLAVLLGVTALVVDVGGLYVARRQMVNAADAAALAGVMEKNKNMSRDAAEAYAVKNGAENFDKAQDVAITGGKDNEIVSVRVARQVDFTFAQVLGFHSSTVGAVASAQRGPGNGLVPFARLGQECECGECETDWVIRNEENHCIKYGEAALKYSSHKDAEFSPGSYGYILLGMMKAGDLRYGIAGGYEGELADLQIGTIHDEGGGNKVGILVDGLEDRLAMVGEPHCTEIGDLPSNPYLCDLVVIIPLVRQLPQKKLEIVGYASLLLKLDESNKELWGYFIEYLTYQDLMNIYGPAVEGFVIRLVKVPAGVF